MRNELNQSNIARECAEWLKEKVEMKSLKKSNSAQQRLIHIEKDGEEKLYFVIETKGNILAEELRGRELSKIACAHKHFEAIGNDVQFAEHDNFNKFIESV